MPASKNPGKVNMIGEVSPHWGQYLEKNDRSVSQSVIINHCYFRLLTFINLLILLFVEECDYAHSTHVG